MTDSITIAVDVANPASHDAIRAVAGVSRTSRDFFVLVGDESQISPVLEHAAHSVERIGVVHSENPTETACKMVLDSNADAVLSCSATSIAVVEAQRHFSTLPGIDRSALATCVPTSRHADNRFTLILDVGANAEVDATDLARFAAIGSGYAQAIFAIDSPRVALLSEPANVPDRVLRAHEILSASSLNFEGYIDGRGIPLGRSDVIVCDGHAGALILSLMDGAMDAMFDVAKSAYDNRLRWKFGLRLLASGLEMVRDVANVVSGSVLLGKKQILVVAEPNADVDEVRSALELALKNVRHDVPSLLAQALTTHE